MSDREPTCSMCHWYDWEKRCCSVTSDLENPDSAACVEYYRPQEISHATDSQESATHTLLGPTE